MGNFTYDSFGRLQIVDPVTNETYTYYGADIAWTLASTALVWIMTPGAGFLYAGLLRRKNALSMIQLSMGTLAVVTFQWFLWGFSLAFSDTANGFIGDLRYFALKDVLERPSILGSPGFVPVPPIVFCVYQLMFAAVTYVSLK